MEETMKIVRDLLTSCYGKRLSCMIITSDSNECKVTHLGDYASLCASLDTCLEAAKIGKGNPSQIAIGNMILDVVTNNYTPNEIVREMEKRINETLDNI